MRIVNLRQRIGAALLAAGMLTPAAAYAAGVNVNLLVDPSFEAVDSNATEAGNYAARALSSWSDGTSEGYTYKYDQNYDKPNAGANDPALNPPDPGLTYYNANFTDGTTDDSSAPGVVMQIVDVSTGDAADAIGAGQAEYWISGWFGAYGNDQGGSAVLHVDFLDGGGASLGTASVTGTFPDWNFNSDSGPVPVGTQTVEASVFEADLASNGSKYVDVVDFTIRVVVDIMLGDVNLDGVVNGLDVDPFVDVLLNGPYQAEADMNEDQVVNGLDVDPFVVAVVGGGAQSIPEPSTLLLCSVALGVVSGWRKWGTQQPASNGLTHV
jgi:hypothetical protein